MIDEPFPDDDDNADNDDSLPLRELNRLEGGACRDCSASYSARDAVSSIALGFKNAPRCVPCLSRRLGRDEADLREQLRDYVHRRECYLIAWREAERRDGASPQPLPQYTGLTVNVSKPNAGPEADADWNAGDMGCGELVMALRVRLNTMPAGNVLHVTATDPAAPEDLPAWCRLCGHTLVSRIHPDYWIRRKGD